LAARVAAYSTYQAVPYSDINHDILYSLHLVDVSGSVKRGYIIDPSTVFSTFHRDQLAKIHRHRWKECLKINKVSKFESDRMKTNKDMAPQSRKILE